MATPTAINSYQRVLDELLSQVNIPFARLQDDPVYNRQLIDDYYDKIIYCIKSACWSTIPHSYQGHNVRDNIVAGWNDIVKDKHRVARTAFLDWVAGGRPRNGPIFSLHTYTARDISATTAKGRV